MNLSAAPLAAELAQQWADTIAAETKLAVGAKDQLIALAASLMPTVAKLIVEEEQGLPQASIELRGLAGVIATRTGGLTLDAGYSQNDLLGKMLTVLESFAQQAALAIKNPLVQQLAGSVISLVAGPAGPMAFTLIQAAVAAAVSKSSNVPPSPAV